MIAAIDGWARLALGFRGQGPAGRAAHVRR